MGDITNVTHFVLPSKKKAPISQGLRTGAGDGDRTHDLMLGKHTL